MNPPDKRLEARAREGGWVVLATLVLSAIATSLTVTWARHAVLAKGTLEMEHGASTSEEDARSGLHRCREQMRTGQSPGCTCTGDEDICITDEGNLVTTEREVESHDRRRLRTHARRVGGTFEEEACFRARARVVPSSNGGGKRTRLDCDTGSGLLLAGLTIITGDVTYQGTELAGLFLIENGAELTLDDVVLRGTIVTRAGLCEDDAPAMGSNRPHVRIMGGTRLLAGTELPDVAMVAPDARLTADATARVDIDGTVVVDELDLPCRGAVRGMVVTETSDNIDPRIRRPGFGRGPQSWSSDLVAGAERVTSMSFPAEGFTVAEMDLMEACDAFNP